MPRDDRADAYYDQVLRLFGLGWLQGAFVSSAMASCCRMGGEMFRIASCIALSLLLAPARGAETADPAQALLEQARQWQFLERPLDGQHALDQLLRIAQPASNLHAEALTLQALGQLQSRQTEQARRTLARLRAQHPGYAGIARVERMFRLRGADSAALLRARALFEAGRAQEAYAAFDKLYQGRPPEGRWRWNIGKSSPGCRAMAGAARRPS
ncbi:cellulose synthase subunit BcsC [Chromobacterium violaceum]|uniref:Cellulose synthase subunit BcsC n=1 Tax=Chromobacterium violaceum TaxID=536 RepID=A0A447TEU4_CHRVL|nr:cellulose synthase subunit BcsC [Chromobacterium violaceum]